MSKVIVRKFILLTRRTLRCVLRDIQQIVSEKFPETKSLFITNVLFFYYFCPALINPKKSGIVRGNLPNRPSLIH